MLKSRNMVFIGGILLGSAFVMYVIGAVLPSWTTKKEGDVFVTNGLWKNCTKHERYVCKSYPLSCSILPKSGIERCTKLMVARMFIIMASTFSFFGAIALLNLGITGKDSSKVIIRSKILVNVSLICGVIGFPIGISWALNSGADKLGAAAVLAIIATTVNCLSAVVISGLPKYEALTSNATVYII